MDLAKWTKFLLDFMFYAGIVVTATLPFSLKWIGTQLERVAENYKEAVIIYFVLGVSAIVLINELRKIFRTVLAEDCFVQENVASITTGINIRYFFIIVNIYQKRHPKPKFSPMKTDPRLSSASP